MYVHVHVYIFIKTYDIHIDVYKKKHIYMYTSDCRFAVDREFQYVELVFFGHADVLFGPIGQLFGPDVALSESPWGRSEHIMNFYNFRTRTFG